MPGCNRVRFSLATHANRTTKYHICQTPLKAMPPHSPRLAAWLLVDVIASVVKVGVQSAIAKVHATVFRGPQNHTPSLLWRVNGWVVSDRLLILARIHDQRHLSSTFMRATNDITTFRTAHSAFAHLADDDGNLRVFPLDGGDFLPPRRRRRLLIRSFVVRLGPQTKARITRRRQGGGLRFHSQNKLGWQRIRTNLCVSLPVGILGLFSVLLA